MYSRLEMIQCDVCGKEAVMTFYDGTKPNEWNLCDKHLVEKQTYYATEGYHFIIGSLKP